MLKKIITSVVLILCTSIIFVIGINKSSENNSNYKKVSVSVIRANYEFNVNNIETMINNVDYVFVGKVENILGYNYENPVEVELDDGTKKVIYDTYTNYDITVIESYKGSMQSGHKYKIQKRGGLDFDGNSISIIENDILPEKEGIYIFFAFEQEDKSILVAGENSNIIVNNIKNDKTIREVKRIINKESV